MIITLARIESLAASNADLKAKVAGLQRRASAFDDVQRDRDRLRGELRTAEAKIDEWFNYSQAWWPLVPKRRHKELKLSVPKPLAIPF